MHKYVLLFAKYGEQLGLGLLLVAILSALNSAFMLCMYAFIIGSGLLSISLYIALFSAIDKIFKLKSDLLIMETEHNLKGCVNGNVRRSETDTGTDRTEAGTGTEAGTT